MKPVALAVVTGVVVAGITAATVLYVVPALKHQDVPPAPALAVAPPAPALAVAPPAPAPVVHEHYVRPAVRHVYHHVAPAYVPPPEQAYVPPPAPPAPPICGNCGVVESVHQVRIEAQPSGGGAVLGGIAGAVLGHQFGRGRGRDLATVAGGVGGALLGNHVEETARGHYVYDETVRRDNGAVSVLRQPTYVPAGQKVRVVNDQAVPE